MAKKKGLNSIKPELLTIILENHTKELELLQSKETHKSSNALINRICYLKYFNDIIENKIIERYLNEKISLNKCAKIILNTTGFKQDIFKKIFTLKVLDNDEFIPLDILQEVINLLDIDQLLIIIHGKKNTIYEELALKKYDELIFRVDEEVLDDLKLKMKIDERGR